MSGLQSPHGQDLDLLSSPTRLTISTTMYESPSKSTTTPTSLTTGTDGFPELSRQLEETTQTLSRIYRNIGYTTSEIKNNEQRLIHSISMAFKDFLDSAYKFQEELQEVNNKSIEALRVILRAIGDPSGLRTIPDLYMRNIIAKGQKPEGTLLNTQKFIKSTKDSIMQDYRSKICRFLDELMILSKLVTQIDNFNSSVSFTIPPFEDTLELKRNFQSMDSLDTLFSYVIAVFDHKLSVQPFLDLSSESFKKLQNTITAYKTEATLRTDFAQSTAKEIIDIWTELGIFEQQKNESTFRGTLFTEIILFYERKGEVFLQAKLDELSQVLSDLTEKKKARIIEKLRHEEICETLWSKLNEDQEYVTQFKASNASLTSECLHNYEIEHIRLLEVKKGYTKEFIEDAKTEIKSLWDTLCYSEDKRNGLYEFYQTESLDDKTLETLESEILRLKQEYQTYKPLLSLTSEFKSLLLDRERLDESTKDSSRLIKKNSHKILMEEEKLRKKLTRQLPKVVSDIKDKLSEMKTAGFELTMISEDILSKVDDEYVKLEKKGRIMPQSNRSSNRATSRVSSVQTSRAPTRNSSRNTSNIPSRTTSPIRQVNSTGTAAFKSSFSHSVQKSQISKRPTITPAILAHERKAVSSRSNSPNKRLEHTQESLLSLLNTPSPLYRSQSSLQSSEIHHDINTTMYQIPKLKRQNSDTFPSTLPLRNSNISRIPVPSTLLKPHTNLEHSKVYSDVFTSPLRSLAKELTPVEDQENISMVSDFGDEDKYSDWRKEQLQKLNKFKTPGSTCSSFLWVLVPKIFSTPAWFLNSSILAKSAGVKIRVEANSLKAASASNGAVAASAAGASSSIFSAPSSSSSDKSKSESSSIFSASLPSVNSGTASSFFLSSSSSSLISYSLSDSTVTQSPSISSPSTSSSSTSQLASSSSPSLAARPCSSLHLANNSIPGIP
ncbi:hypothetical protein WICPIJ_000447 [Wickerhamomyces pijperi]|uniref:Uncharacterized protein n=1 Tax=Wickerhamomyces pijperi TaxID=599730 RepID=A0A9P8TSJ7_WICPI|nr:hypothetical protein WICPIJ_000447 [Wickerhamomyces pijperi]